LEEDFKHLIEQTDLLWATRQKMASVRQKNTETKWTSLTNAFTYFFAPVTIVSGVYGMNVSPISGDPSNPSIWQFFVVVVGLNAVILLAIAILNWIQIHFKHKRTPGMKEVLELAIGKG
jgi:Mg2+ and Co2+ transporter CorA